MESTACGTRMVNEMDNSYRFTNNDQDVKAIREMYPNAVENGFEAFFVKINGDYTEVWGIWGTIPENWKVCWRIK